MNALEGTSVSGNVIAAPVEDETRDRELRGLCQAWVVF